MATMVPMDRSIPWTLGRQTGVKAGAVAGAGVEVQLEQDEREMMDAVVDGDVQGGPSAHSAAAAMIFLGDVQGGAGPVRQPYFSTEIPNFTTNTP